MSRSYANGDKFACVVNKTMMEPVLDFPLAINPFSTIEGLRLEGLRLSECEFNGALLSSL
jgi:hypothetical protein